MADIQEEIEEKKNEKVFKHFIDPYSSLKGDYDSYWRHTNTSIDFPWIWQTITTSSTVPYDDSEEVVM